MAKQLYRRRVNAAARTGQASGVVAPCVIDRSSVILGHRETKILIFVYGVLISLVTLRVEALTASGIAVSAGIALITALKKA